MRRPTELRDLARPRAARGGAGGAGENRARPRHGAPLRADPRRDPLRGRRAKRCFVSAICLVVARRPPPAYSPFLADFQKKRVQTFSRVGAREERRGRRRAARGSNAQTRAAREAARAPTCAQAQLSELKRDEGYQSHCAQTSIGSGGLLGKGLGQGPHEPARYLPAPPHRLHLRRDRRGVGLRRELRAVLLLLQPARALVPARSRQATRDRFSRLVCVGAAACRRAAGVRQRRDGVGP